MVAWVGVVGRMGAAVGAGAGVPVGVVGVEGREVGVSCPVVPAWVGLPVRGTRCHHIG